MKKRIFFLLAVLCLLTLPLILPATSAQARKLLASFLTSTTSAQNSPWPSLAAQLTKAKAAPGSAFEQLIKDNQEFGMLRLDEADDKRGLPPWIRVWWRKAHPELVYSSTDPTGGYPLVLKEIVEWMEHHQDLKPGKADPSFPPQANPEATITGEQRISGPQSSPRSESDIRINYFDPMKIISGSNAIVSSGRQAIFYSTDGGTSWGQTSLPFTASDTFHSDPTVDWTSDGRGWSSTLGIQGGTLRMRNYFTTDNGATWTFEATPSGSQTSVDKQMVWVDHSSSSPFFNQQYAIWHNGTPGYVSRRTAGVSGTWSTPLQVTGSESTGTAIGSDIKTNSAGEVFAFWPTTGNRRIFVAKSTNGGTSYGTPVQIATTFDGFDIGVPSFNGRRALIYTASAAYKTQTKNLVYTSWTDLSGETGCTAPANEPGSNINSTCKTRIWFARSTDGGATWSPAVKINNQAGLNDQFNQWLVVDETNGSVAIMYYDTVADTPGRKKVHVYYQISTNDGVTWSTPQQITTAQTDETTSGSDSGNQYGDYNGLSGYAGIFFPSWTDRRNNAREEIWTAKITETPCTPPDVPTGAGASATAFNQITVNWTNGASPASTFKVYRATGTCVSPGSFSLIASGVSGTSYIDNTVSGGVTYAYKVVGVDAAGVCESEQSTCAQATAAGCPPNTTVVVSPTTLPAGFNGTAYSQSLSASGGTEPYTFSLDSGSLPNGVNLVGANLTGTPNTTGVFNFVIKATDANGCVGTRNYSVVISGAGLMFYPITPCRLLDTRVTPPEIQGGTSKTQIARGLCGIPTSAQAVIGNVTTVTSPGGGYLTIYPSDTAQPTVANSNFMAGDILNNVFTVGLGNADGAFKIFVTSTTHVVVDVTGYYAAPQSGGLYFHPLPSPVRLLETRSGEPGCFTPGTPLTGNTEFLQQGTGTCSGVTIPSTAKALVGNATTVNPTGAGYLTLFPANVIRPLISSGNYNAGEILNSQVVVGLSPTGQFKIFTLATTHLVLDVTGYFSEDAMDANGLGLLFTPITPSRLLDTRPSFTGCFTPATPIAATVETPQMARGVCTIANMAQAIVGNATVVQPALGGFLTFWPSTVTRPTVATSNYLSGQIFNRHFTVGLGTDGAFKIYALSTTELVIDVSGYYAP